jgi:2-keto-4-pentenoate hydratase/2-oxohepta-3-ene-1,7-dioic acid hydratase in catechol pathway
MRPCAPLTPRVSDLTPYCMRLCRFGNGRLGVVDGDNGATAGTVSVRDVTDVLDGLPSYRHPLPGYDVLIAHLDELAPRIEMSARTAPSVALEAVSLLSPVANPGKLIAAPVNYQKHHDEVVADPALHHHNAIAVIERAGLFLKATSALIGPGDAIMLRKLDRRTDHEVELACVIGKRANNVSRATALDYVAGYCIGLDITIRGPEERSLRKSPDSYAVLGPWLVTADQIPDPGALELRLTVNGTIRQQAHTRDLIMSVPELIEYASSFYTLFPGDVNLTGTPEGVGPIEPGDFNAATIDAVGTMYVNVRAA